MVEIKSHNGKYVIQGQFKGWVDNHGGFIIDSPYFTGYCNLDYWKINFDYKPTAPVSTIKIIGGK
jgi:hypothetical protein